MKRYSLHKLSSFLAIFLLLGCSLSAMGNSPSNLLIREGQSAIKGEITAIDAGADGDSIAVVAGDVLRLLNPNGSQRAAYTPPKKINKLEVHLGSVFTGLIHERTIVELLLYGPGEQESVDTVLVCLDFHGKVLWKKSVWGFAEPARYGNEILVWTPLDFGTEMVDMSGNILWTNSHVSGEVCGISSDGKLSLISEDGGSTYAFKRNGSIAWKLPVAYRQIAIAKGGQPIVFYCNARDNRLHDRNHISCYSAYGKLLWRKDIEADVLAISDNGMFILAGSGDSIQMLDSTGKVLWSQKYPGSELDQEIPPWVSNDGKRAIVLTYKNRLTQLYLVSLGGKSERMLSVPLEAKVSISADGHRIAADRGNMVTIYRLL